MDIPEILNKQFRKELKGLLNKHSIEKRNLNNCFILPYWSNIYNYVYPDIMGNTNANKQIINN